MLVGKLPLPRALYAIRQLSTNAYSKAMIKSAWARCCFEGGAPLNYHKLLEERFHELYKATPSKNSVTNGETCSDEFCAFCRQVELRSESSAWAMPDIDNYKKALDIPDHKCGKCRTMIPISEKHCGECTSVNPAFDAAAAVAIREGKLEGWRRKKLHAEESVEQGEEAEWKATFIGYFGEDGKETRLAGEPVGPNE